MNTTMLLMIFISGVCIFLILLSAAAMLKRKDIEEKEEEQVKGLMNKLNHSSVIKSVGNSIPDSQLESIFNRAKNPWRMTLATFQAVRFIGLGFFIILAISGYTFFGFETGLFLFSIGILCYWYPMYYYKAIGDEREAQWNKTYEYIWVIKHNITLYDPAKAYMNVKLYIEKHAPHNQEIIQGFEDFYRYWNQDEIDPYIRRFYPFPVTREITQIIFNMHKTGEFPEEALNSLRSFIVNTQNLTVEKTLSSVSGKATMFSLPFLMFSVIIALMVPLIFQILRFF